MSTHANSSGRTYGGESQAARKARRRQQFIEAGLEVFGTVGYRQATVRQLCKQAKLTDRYFYEEFGAAEDLLMAVYLDCIGHIRAALMERAMQVRGKPVEHVVRAMLDAFFGSIEDPRLARVVWLEVAGVSARVDKTYMDGMRGFADLLLQLGGALYPEVVQRKEVQRMTAIGMIGAVSEVAKHWSMGAYAEPRAAVAESTAILFTSMVQTLAALSAEA